MLGCYVCQYSPLMARRMREELPARKTLGREPTFPKPRGEVLPLPIFPTGQGFQLVR
jgi:hypothetical protein